MARAPALQAGGQEFDSPHLHQHIEKYIEKDEGKLAYKRSMQRLNRKVKQTLGNKLKSEVKLQRA